MTPSSLKNFIGNVVLFSLGLGPVSMAGANVYTTLVNEFPSAYFANKDSEAQSATQQFNFEVQQLSRTQQRTLAVAILSENDAADAQGQLDDAGRKDLEVLNQANLHTRINRTETAFGDIALAKLLIEPTADREELRNRQNVIQQLIGDENFFSGAHNALKNIAESSKTFLTFWQEPNAVEQGTINGLYFGQWLDPLNRKPFALGSRLRLQDMAFIASIYGAGFGWLFIQKQIYKHVPGIKDFLPLDKMGIDTTISLRNVVLSPVDQFTDQYKMNSYLGEKSAQWMIGQELSPAAKQRAKIIAAANVGQGALMAIWQKKIFFEAIVQRKNIANNLQAHLIQLATGIDNLKKINDLLVERKIRSFDAITDLFDDSNKHSAQFHKLMHLLNSHTFTGEASFFSLTGKVLTAHKLTQEVKDELRDAFEALGKFDALVSTAKLMKEYSDKRVAFCFVDFVAADSPSLELTEFWNPLVDADVVVPNTVKLGNPARTMILTGPNTGGKSTVIKGITLNILLAQTLGIAAARSMKLTPVTTLSTNINVTDNVKENLSLFAAETARAKRVLGEMSSLQPHQFGFCVFDETFRGTSPDHAEKLSCWYAKELAKFKNIICLHATHYPTMINLEEQTNGSCKNYKVEIEKLADGSLKRDYLLKEGSTLHNVAVDILIEQGLMTQ